MIKTLFASFLALALLSAGALAQNTPADAALARVVQTYADLKSGQIDIAVEVTDPEYASTQDTRLLVQRPKHLSWHGHATTPKDATGFDVWVVFDGKDVHLYDSRDKAQVLVQKVPDHIRAIDIGDYFNMGLANQVLDMMTGDPARIVAGRKMSLENNVLRFQRQGDGGKTEVEEMHIDPATNRVTKFVTLVDGKSVAVANFTYSKMGETLDEAMFRFATPAGAKVVRLEEPDEKPKQP